MERNNLLFYPSFKYFFQLVQQYGYIDYLNIVNETYVLWFVWLFDLDLKHIRRKFDVILNSKVLIKQACDFGA